MFKAVCFREYSLESIRKFASQVSSKERMDVSNRFSVSAKLKQASLRRMFDAMGAEMQFQRPPGLARTTVYHYIYVLVLTE